MSSCLPLQLFMRELRKLGRLQELQKSNRFLPVTSAVFATGLTMYCLSLVFKHRNGRKGDSKRYRVIRTPPGSLFHFGHSLKLGTMPAHKVTQWHKELGPILRVKMGTNDCIFVGESRMANDLFSMEASLTSSKPHFIFGNALDASHTASITHDSKWDHIRTAMARFLTPSVIVGFEQIIQDKAHQTVDQLIKRTQHQGSADILSVIRCTSINILLKAVFDHHGVKTLSDPLYKRIMSVSGASQEYAGFWSSIPGLSFLQTLFGSERQMRRYVNTVSYPQIARLIEKARNSSNDNLVKSIDLVKEEYDIDDQDIIAMMSELLVAGTDTVSSSIAWTLAILCHYPEAQQILIDELDNFIDSHNRSPKFEDRRHLPFYNAVQKECLRLRSPIYFSIPRTTTEDVIYRNYLIPKGSAIVCNIHALHNCNYAFTEADKFIPERFLDDKQTMFTRSKGRFENRDHFAFGWTGRMCPGIAIAENEMFTIIIKIMEKCRIEPTIASNGQAVYPDLEDIRDRGATVVPGNFKLRFTLRPERWVL